MAGVVHPLQIHEIIPVVTSTSIFGSKNSLFFFLESFLLESCFTSNSQFHSERVEMWSFPQLTAWPDANPEFLWVF